MGFSAMSRIPTAAPPMLLQTKWSSLQGRTLRVGADGTEPGLDTGLIRQRRSFRQEIDLLTDFY